MAFQSDAFQSDAFQVSTGEGPRNIINFARRYLNDLSTIDTSTHSVSFNSPIRDANVITYMRRYLNDII